MDATPRQRFVMLRLSIMMFLQYAVWGAWLPIAARYLKAGTDEGGLGFSDGQIGWLLGTAGSVGALLSPFIAGQFADRFFRSERFLATLLLLGAGLMFAIVYQTTYNAWLVLSIAYSVVFMPTLALSNSIAFAHVRDARRDFPIIRVWGTLGWIAASWTFPMLWLQSGLEFSGKPPFLVGEEVGNVTGRLVHSMTFAAAISFVYALYAFFLLPATPPKREGVNVLAFAKAFRFFLQPSLLILGFTALSVAALHQIYFMQTGPYFNTLGVRDADIGPAMTIGQFSEILMMFFLGIMLKNLGFRTVLILGVGAYLVRYAIWSQTYLPVELLVGSQFLHGFCYACFFAGSYIYVDRMVTDDVRHSAQTVYGMVILGGGPILGGIISGWLGDTYTSTAGDETTTNYAGLWMAVAAIGGFTLLVFGLLFRDQTKESKAVVQDPERGFNEP